MTESTALPKGTDFLPRTAIARGVFILAEELRALQRPLESMNFKVFALSPGLKEEQIALLLAQRVLVTNKASDFQEIAAICECSIIEIGNIDRGALLLSKEISQTWTRLGLKHKQPFLLRLYLDAEPVLTDIE
jgi:hypothetical protein